LKLEYGELVSSSAFKLDLRRYNMVVADAAIMKTQIAELRMNEAGAYPRPLLSST
jgi:hypothetical protein